MTVKTLNSLSPQSDSGADLLRITKLQRSAEHWTRHVVNGTIFGLVLTGPPGVGKTHTVVQYLESSDVRHAKIRGHITPLQLYGILYQYRDAVVLIDDTESVLQRDVGVSILRAALEGDGSDRRRIVSYETTIDIGIPTSFTFTGGVIYVGNSLPRSRHATVQAFVDRVKVIPFKVTAQDVWSFLRQVVTANGYSIYYGPSQRVVEVSRSDCLSVIDALEQLGIANLRDFSRALIAWLDFSDTDPERMAFELELMAEETTPLSVESKKTLAAKTFRQLCADRSLTLKNQLALFVERTGMSEATFWRYKKDHES